MSGAKAIKMPAGDYHAAPSVGSSMLSTFLRSGPEVYRHQHIAQDESEGDPPEHFRIGQAVHSLIEGDESWVAIPSEVLTKNGQRRGKAWEQFRDEHQGQLLLSESDADTARKMGEAIMRNPVASRLLSLSDLSERSIFWDDDRISVGRKCRPDNLSPGVIIDIKTTKLARPDVRAFGRAAYDWGYHRQAATYQDGVRELTGEDGWQSVYIVASKIPPYLVYAHRWGDDAILLGDTENDAALRALESHYESDTWDDPASGELRELVLPPWAWEKAAHGQA